MRRSDYNQYCQFEYCPCGTPKYCEELLSERSNLALMKLRASKLLHHKLVTFNSTVVPLYSLFVGGLIVEASIVFVTITGVTAEKTYILI